MTSCQPLVLAKQQLVVVKVSPRLCGCWQRWKPGSRIGSACMCLDPAFIQGGQLFLWFGGSTFQKKDPAPGVFPNKTGVKPTDLKEQKWG